MVNTYFIIYIISVSQLQDDDPVHVISVPEHVRAEKPPEYETCIVHPPSYDDAVQLSPVALLVASVTRPPTNAAPISYETACCSSVIQPTTNVSCSNVTSSSQTAPATATINMCRVTCVGPVTR